MLPFFSRRKLSHTFAHPDPTAFIGLMDFSYQHYALGDAFTMEIDMAVGALEAGRSVIDLIVTVNPARPAARLQSYVTPLNYLSYFEGLFPAFLCTPLLRSIAVIRDRPSLNYHLTQYVAGGQPMWPTFEQHLRTQQPYPIPHHRINAFHRRHGYIPRLNAPRGYDRWAKQFLARHLADRIVAVINPRQSALANASAALYRDAPFAEWMKFIRAVEANHPDVMFLAVGGFAEWESTLQCRPNVFIPRTRGLNLAHELALFANTQMFLGSMSGFANFAVFSDMPYAIFGVEHRIIDFTGTSIGDRHYPFGNRNQLLMWESENAKSLMETFEGLLDAVKSTPRFTPAAERAESA
jgi:hypothetical protein